MAYSILKFCVLIICHIPVFLLLFRRGTTGNQTHNPEFLDLSFLCCWAIPPVPCLFPPHPLLCLLSCFGPAPHPVQSLTLTLSEFLPEYFHRASTPLLTSLPSPHIFILIPPSHPMLYNHLNPQPCSFLGSPYLGSDWTPTSTPQPVHLTAAQTVSLRNTPAVSQLTSQHQQLNHFLHSSPAVGFQILLFFSFYLGHHHPKS